MLKPAPFKFKTFSRKQKQLLTWWMPGSPHCDRDMIIASGAIRSGKTLPMSLSFVIWAMTTFNNQNFGMSGKTIGALRRNVIILLKVILRSRGYKVNDRRGDIHYLEIIKGNVTNYFFLFGGYNEQSQDLIQGVTLAGMYFDEVAIMPESFVNQAVGRCSVEGARFWFNCNPQGPFHWFKTGWIDDLDEKNALYIEFGLDDNLSLSDKTKVRYRRLFSGVFYQRYILGLWVLAEGIIYSMFDDDENIFDEEPENLRYKARRYAAVDYGTTNPMVFLEIWDDDDTIYQTREYYYSSKDKAHEGQQKTDSQYADDFEEFFGPATEPDAPIEVILDPSAASFKAELRNRGYRVKDANNDVADGIRVFASVLGLRMYKVHRSCVNTIREFKSYVWDEKATLRGVEQPLKQNDHAMDAGRYWCLTKIKNWRLQKAA
jgi:PBSX family phage terminase large subunit